MIVAGVQRSNTPDIVRTFIKVAFAAIAAFLYAYAAWVVFWGAVQTPAFAPNSAQTTILETFGAALIAFIAAQLGISVMKDGGNFRAKLRAVMGGSIWGLMVLIIDLILVLIVGFAFIVLWLNPSLIEVAPEGEPLKEAPGYVAVQAKLFIGLVVAATAAVGTSN